MTKLNHICHTLMSLVSVESTDQTKKQYSLNFVVEETFFYLFMLIFFFSRINMTRLPRQVTSCYTFTFRQWRLMFFVSAACGIVLLQQWPLRLLVCFSQHSRMFSIPLPFPSFGSEVLIFLSLS